jgi:hypothetical protein
MRAPWHVTITMALGALVACSDIVGVYDDVPVTNLSVKNVALELSSQNPANQLTIRIDSRVTNSSSFKVRLPIEQYKDGSLRLMHEANPYDFMFRKRQMFGWIAGTKWEPVTQLIEHYIGRVDKWVEINPGQSLDLAIEARWSTPLICKLRGSDARIEFRAADEDQKQTVLLKSGVFRVPEGQDEVGAVCSSQRK